MNPTAKSTEALILIDIQNDYFPGGRFPLRGMKRAAKRAAALADDFRSRGIPVIHVRHISLKEGAFFFLPDTFGSEIQALVTPAAGETVFIKHFPNSFRETGLGAHLDELGATTLHLAGAMTNMCIDTTARAGFDLGYKMIIHAKACAAPALLGTGLIHGLFLRNLSGTFAEVRK